MKKESKKRIDLYDIGDGLTLMNLILRSREIIPRSWYKLLAIIFANP